MHPLIVDLQQSKEKLKYIMICMKGVGIRMGYDNMNNINNRGIGREMPNKQRVVRKYIAYLSVRMFLEELTSSITMRVDKMFIKGIKSS